MPIELTELLESLPSNINRELFEKLLAEYQGIKNAYYLQNYEMVLNKAGKFVEATFQILSHLAFGEIPKQPNIEKISKELENIQNDNQPKSIRILIPRVAKTLYTLRSKRGAVHIDEVSPDFIDSTFALASCNWILSEFFRLFLKKEPSELIEIINSISSIPLVEEISGELVVLNPEMTAKQQILTILFQKYPSFVSREDIKRWVKNKSDKSISSALSELERDSYIFRNEKWFKLTMRGIEEAGKIQLEYRGQK